MANTCEILIYSMQKKEKKIEFIGTVCKNSIESGDSCLHNSRKFSQQLNALTFMSRNWILKFNSIEMLISNHTTGLNHERIESIDRNDNWIEWMKSKQSPTYCIDYKWMQSKQNVNTALWSLSFALCCVTFRTAWNQRNVCQQHQRQKMKFIFLES